MAYTPVAQRNQKPQNGYTPVSQRKTAGSTPSVTVTKAQPQATLNVVHSKSNAVIVPPGFVGPIKPNATTLAPKIEIQGQTKEIPKPKADTLGLQPSAKPNSYTPFSQRVTGVNGTPVPESVKERTFFSPVSDFLDLRANRPALFASLAKQVGQAADAELNKSSKYKKTKLALGLAKDVGTQVIQNIGQKTGVTEALQTFFADPEKQFELVSKDFKTNRDLIIGTVALLGLDTGAGGIDDAARAFLKGIGASLEEAGRLSRLAKETESVDKFITLAKNYGLEADESRQLFSLTKKIELPIEKPAIKIGKETSPLVESKTIASNLRQSEVPTRAIEEGTTLEDTTKALDFGKDVSYEGNINPTPGYVKPPSVRGGITPPELDLKAFEDKPTFSLGRETLERNIERVAGKDAGKLQEFIVEPVRTNETARVKFVNELKDEVKNLIKEIGIKAGSKEDALIQRFGEKRISLEELKKATPKYKEVQKASEFFRGKYDELLDKVNSVRQKFGYEPIPKRADYFRHFEEINNAISQFGLIFRKQDLPTEIAGITDIFKPGKPFSTAELKRKGGKFTESAIKGFDNYISTISKQIYHIDSVQRARALEKYIRQAGEAGQANLPNLVANISEYGNLLAGKKAKIDRAFESIVGRKVYEFAQILKRQTGINLVGGNIASAITNFIPFTQSLSTTSKPSAIRGLFEGLVSPFIEDFTKIDDVESSFLVRRFPEKDIAPSFTKNVLDKGGFLFETIDRFTSKSIVAGKYYENLGKGLEPTKAMNLADSYAGKVLADRSIGQLPNIFGSQSLGFITQFQTEVNNMYSFVIRDIPNLSEGSKIKLASSLVQFTLYSYLFNNAYEYVTGRRPTIDPIYAGLTVAGLTDNESQSVGNRVKEAGKDIAGNLPFGNVIFEGGRLPISSIIPSPSKLFSGDFSELQKLVPSQIRKTAQGLSAYNEGEVTDKSGKTQFDIDQNAMNFLRSLLFGKYSTPEAQQYFQNRDNPKPKSGVLPSLPKLQKLPSLPKIK